jgi:hypothetical protein
MRAAEVVRHERRHARFEVSYRARVTAAGDGQTI